MHVSSTPLYPDELVKGVADACGIHRNDTARLSRLRDGLEYGATWFGLSLGSKELVPKAETVRRLERLGKAAGRVRAQALAMAEGDLVEEQLASANKPLPRRSPSRYAQYLGTLNQLMSAGDDPDHDLSFESPIANALSGQIDGKEHRLSEMRTRLAHQEASAREIARIAAELAFAAHDAAIQLTAMRGNMIRPGHSGDTAMNGWIDDMLNLYVVMTGRPVGTSTGAPGTANEGVASGPLIRFLMAAFGPIACELRNAGRPVPDLHEDAWASRIRTAREAAEKANGCQEPPL